MRRDRVMIRLLSAMIAVMLLSSTIASHARADILYMNFDKESEDAWVQEQRAPESALLSAFPDNLRREDGVLLIMADNGTALPFNDSPCYCSFSEYFFAIAYSEPLQSFLIWHWGYKTNRYLLVHKPTGSSAELLAQPEIEAGSRQFVAVNPEPGRNAGIQVGHESDAGIVLDAEIFLPHFQFGSWISPDRIELDTSRRPMPFGALTDEETALLYIVENETETEAHLERIDGRWRLSVSIAIPMGVE